RAERTGARGRTVRKGAKAAPASRVTEHGRKETTMTLKRGLKGIAAALLLGAASLMPAAAQAETLKFISWQKDEAGVKDWWAAPIAEFEARNPGTTIEWTKVDRGAYADT